MFGQVKFFGPFRQRVASLKNAYEFVIIEPFLNGSSIASFCPLSQLWELIFDWAFELVIDSELLWVH